MSIQETPVQERATDEISLFEIWAALVARKLIVFGTAAVFLLLGILYLLWVPRIYVSTADLALGDVRQGGNVSALDSADELSKALLGEYGEDRFAAKDYPILTAATMDKKQPKVLHLEVGGTTPAEAQAYLTTIVEKTLGEHRKLIGAFRGVQEQALSDVSGQAQDLRAQLRELERELAIPGNKREATEAAVIQLMRATLVDRLASLEARKSQIELEMTEIYSRPTRLLTGPKLPERPAKPKKSLVIVLATLFGLLSGAMIALVLGSFSKRRGGIPAGAQEG